MGGHGHGHSPAKSTGKLLTNQEKTAKALSENIVAEAYISKHGFGPWMKEMVRGLGRHPWPKYFEVTDFFGDKRHGDFIPRNFAAVRQMPLKDIAPVLAVLTLSAHTFVTFYWRRHTTLLSDSIIDKYGYKSPYTKEFKSQFGNDKPAIPATY